MRNRAYRRFRREIARQHARHIVKDIWRMEEKWIENNVRRMTDTPKPCSCSMCGNPRRKAWKPNEKRTLQERRGDISL